MHATWWTAPGVPWRLVTRRGMLPLEEFHPPPVPNHFGIQGTQPLSPFHPASTTAFIRGMKHYGTVTVIGRDKTGVIAGITHFLFEQRANIEALEEQVTRGQFSMTLQASWKTSHFDRNGIRTGLAELGRSLGMEIRVRFSDPRKKQRVAILATREPHCLQGLLESFKGVRLPAEPSVVIANRTELAPLAKKFGVPFVHIPWNERGEAEAAVLVELEKHDIDFIVLARFMKILSPNFVWRYKNKIINIHPSLLPSFPGPQAYRQAYEHGVKIVGVTAHFVSMHLDEGPIIAQDCFRLTPRMSLKEIVERGQSLETKTLTRAVKLYLARRLDVYWGTVREV